MEERARTEATIIQERETPHRGAEGGSEGNEGGSKGGEGELSWKSEDLRAKSEELIATTFWTGKET